MKLLIGADLVPTESNIEAFVRGDANFLVGEKLNEVIKNASYRIFNLEVPLCDVETPIKKCGPNLKASCASIAGYKALNIDLVTIANNHILDQGFEGLDSTISTLDEAGIAHVGAGKNSLDASAPYVFQFAGKRVGVYACSEHEFSIATERTPGANPFDPLVSLEIIEDIKKKVDFLIVLYHGGREWYRYPTPWQQRTCQKIVDKGADLVICQHSHCIGCEEKYKQGRIIYGQGNFLFDHSDEECWQTGLLIGLDGNFDIEYIPIVKQLEKVRLAEQGEKDKIIDEFNERSAQILNKDFVDDEYSKAVAERLDFYLANVMGINGNSLFHKLLNKVTGFKWRQFLVKRKMSDFYRYNLINYFECEQHRELLIRGLKQ